MSIYYDESGTTKEAVTKMPILSKSSIHERKYGFEFTNYEYVIQGVIKILFNDNTMYTKPYNFINNIIVINNNPITTVKTYQALLTNKININNKVYDIYYDLDNYIYTFSSKRLIVGAYIGKNIKIKGISNLAQSAIANMADYNISYETKGKIIYIVLNL